MNQKFKPSRIAGFTLIELLIVIAIIAILASILLPVLARAKLKATEAYCLNNDKQLAAGWYMYSGDNKEQLMSIIAIPWPGAQSGGGFWGANLNAAPMTGGSQGLCLSTIQEELASSNLLYAYCANVQVYHCPGDVRLNLPVGSGNSIGWAYDSYAITENVEPGGNDSDGFSNTVSSIKRPSNCCIEVEQADTRGYNRGTFVCEANSSSRTITKFEDVFALYHGNVGTFSFADGHAEYHKWLDPIVIADGKYSLIQGSVGYEYSACPAGTPPTSGTLDDGWIIDHFESPSDP